MKLNEFKKIVNSKFLNFFTVECENKDNISIKIPKSILLNFCFFLKNNNKLKLNLLDISGVDYLDYKKSYWSTKNASNEGFSRAHKSDLNYLLYKKNRFCVSYHLLSYVFNFRIRLRIFLDLYDMFASSVINVWPTANWHERELYDLFGVIFVGHPNLTRILTDYNFSGYPLRKDFPLAGEYEVRYDENKKKIVREASHISRVIDIPKITRKDFHFKKM